MCIYMFFTEINNHEIGKGQGSKICKKGRGSLIIVECDGIIHEIKIILQTENTVISIDW